MLKRFHAPALLLLTLLAGCARYTTPGGAAPMSTFTGGDYAVEERMKRQPAAAFPARIAVVRVQDAGYDSYREHAYGRGRYSVVTTRDTEREKHLERLASWPMVAGVAPVNRLLLSPDLKNDKELREAAASLRCDMVLLYTFDTRFNIKSHDIGPLNMIALGAIPNKEARVSSTASAVILDVRTGFVYGVAESTVDINKFTTPWSSRDAMENARVNAEAQAMEKLVGELEKTWKGIVEEHEKAHTAASRNGACNGERVSSQ